MNTYFALKALDGLTESNTVIQMTTSQWVMFGVLAVSALAVNSIILHFIDKKHGNISSK